MTHRLAILASGAGSNAHNIIEHFRNSTNIHVALIASNNPGAGVLKIADAEKIPSFIITKENFAEGDEFLSVLFSHNITFIVLAGFLKKIQPKVVNAFEKRIINIHPALLPKYGGKGMYGHFVHEAVYAAREKESGITIHYVDENYDEGNIIFQAKTTLESTDSPDDIERKVRTLELLHFPAVIENVLQNRVPL